MRVVETLPKEPMDQWYFVILEEGQTWYVVEGSVGSKWVSSYLYITTTGQKPKINFDHVDYQESTGTQLNTIHVPYISDWYERIIKDPLAFMAAHYVL